MAKTRALLTRSRAHPDLEWKMNEGHHTRIWIMNTKQTLDLGHKHPFWGPGVVIEVESPSCVNWHEYDVDSPFVWAWISRLMHEGDVTNRGVVLSLKKEQDAPVNRTIEFEERK